MASEDRIEAPTGGLLGRRGTVRWVIAAAAIVLGVFVVIGALPLLYALAGFVVIFAAGLLVADRGGNEAARVITASPPRLNEALLDAVMEGLSEAAILLDREGRLIAANAAARALAPALTRGQRVSLALRMPEIVDAVRQASATGEARSVEFSLRVPVDRAFVAHVAPLAGEGAGLMLLVFQDLTPLRRVEEMRADFVANASHELRTPLAALSGFIDTLRGSARDDASARERFLTIMKTQATRMARLIDDLLSLSRVELNEHLHPDKQVDLFPIVRQVTDGLQTLARDRGVEIVVAPPAAPMVVLGDRDELTRVFENLVENALKYGASGKRVEIGFATADTPAGADVLVSVRDHGPGIAAEHLPRLTERFYRVDVTQSRAEGGTGLGLSLVKHILNRHRGRITIESTVGQGATFTARLPLVHSESR